MDKKPNPRPEKQQKRKQRYINFRKERIRGNWKFLNYYIGIVHSMAFIIEGGLNEFKTMEHFTSGVGALVVFAIVLGFYILQKYTQSYSRIAGPVIFISFCVWMCEIVVQNGEYKIYEGCLVLISLYYLITISIVVDLAIMPFIMIGCQVYTLLRFFTCLEDVPQIAVSCYVAPIVPFTIFCIKLNDFSWKEFLFIESKEKVIKNLHKLLKAFPERIAVTKRAKAKTTLSFTNDPTIEALLNHNTTKLRENITRLENFDISDSDEKVKNETISISKFLKQEIQKLESSDTNKIESNIKAESAQDLVKEENKYYTVTTKKVSLVDEYGDEECKECNERTFLHIFTDKTSSEELKNEIDLKAYQRLMLSNVAHEFRNPLSAVSGNLDLIELVSTEQKVKEFARRAKISSKMINFYVDDILDLSRIERGGFNLNPEDFKVKELINDVKELYEGETEKRFIQMTFKMTDLVRLQTINADKRRIMQVLINLVSNVIKFTSNLINIEFFEFNDFQMQKSQKLKMIDFQRFPKNTFRDLLEDSIISSQANELACKITEKYKIDPSEYLFVCLTDNGEGILKEDQKSLFKLFGKIEKTHHKNKKGCGLGLTICKKIINKSEGFIDLISSPEGSTFGFCIKIDKEKFYFSNLPIEHQEEEFKINPIREFEFQTYKSKEGLS
ncbi:unnamed protein product [Moneuplotes crassus]|uniref:Histidine kinase domain-containing protein n=1 Tax=Euplotes crassus TaxID=5936 RepID=A0AAD1Y1X0_EUPCR|nr:unnamed protein product [Moneuplotes crassus]